MNEYNLLIGIIVFIVGFVIAFWIKGLIVSQKVKAAEKETSRILKDAKLRSETLIKEAKLDVKDRLFKMKSEFDAETKETRFELKRRERRLMQKEENIDRKAEQFERRDRDLLRKEKKIIHKEEKIERKEKQYQELLEEQKRQLEKISGLTAEQAKELLIRAMENEARYEGAKIIKRIENETKEQADKKAAEIMATAIQRYAGDFGAETAQITLIASKRLRQNAVALRIQISINIIDQTDQIDSFCGGIGNSGSKSDRAARFRQDGWLSRFSNIDCRLDIRDGDRYRIRYHHGNTVAYSHSRDSIIDNARIVHQAG